jgi:hypothetical protein|eukprot:scaffold1529_cov243-Chaetoceros_neogracile.AAC.8
MKIEMLFGVADIYPLIIVLLLVIVFLACYVQYVHHKRKIITDNYLHRIPYPTTAEEAHEIVRKFSFQDFPFLADKALEFGLFKTYGVPSIASILSSTGELTNKANKRYDDTSIIIREFMEHPPSYARAGAAVKQMNFIHSHYKISNRDYLYVLSVFIVEPIAWAEKFGYREVSPKEKKAMYLRWKFIGEQMDIKQIPSSYEETESYMQAYEQKYMRYSENSKEIANGTMQLLLSVAPFKCLHQRFLHPIVHALCPPLLRQAMGFPHVSPWFVKFVESLLHLHSFVVRHVVLPKDVIETRTSLDDKDYEATQIHDKAANATRKKLYTNYDPYASTYKHGYLIEELGPIKFCPMRRDPDGVNTKKRQ